MSRSPRQRFTRPDDALEQLERAAAYHERLFGRRPGGLWPSEGSVSDAMVPLVAEAGFKWMATDEDDPRADAGQPFRGTAAGQVDQPNGCMARTRPAGGARWPAGSATMRCPT